MFECLNNIKALELETEKGILQGHAKEMDGSCLKISKVTESFHQSLFKEIDEEGGG